MALSGTGSAANTAGVDACGVGWGQGGGTETDVVVGIGCIAVSGTGDASNVAGDHSCGVGSGDPSDVSIAVGCVAFSGTGHTTNTAGIDSCGFLAGSSGIAFGCFPPGYARLASYILLQDRPTM
jgi:hypothetical protein